MRRYLNLLFVLATIVVNGLANALPINGQTTGEISARFEVCFTPAGYVFSIWGLIYLALLGFAVYQLLPAQRNRALIDRISGPLRTSCMANMAWILLWHYEYFAATLAVMVVLLVSLLRIWLTLQSAGAAGDSGERWLLRIPFSIYSSWVVIAALANLTVVLEAENLRPFAIGAPEWAVLMIVAGGLAALTVGWIRGDLAWLAVVVWAFTGIAVRQDWSGAVALTAAGFAGAVLLQGIWITLVMTRFAGSADHPRNEAESAARKS